LASRVYKFAVDASLGRLANHLRLMGFDADYQDRGDALAFFQGSGPERIALTRIRHLCGRLPQKKWLFIGVNDPDEQVVLVLTAFEVELADLHPFSRCMHCNRAVEVLEKDAVWGRVPDYVWQTQPHFSSCPRCGRVFWPGSHTSRYRKKINHWFKRRSEKYHE